MPQLQLKFRLESLLFSGLLSICLAASAFAADPPAAVGPSYVDLEPAFTLNYGDPRRTRYIQTSLTLRVRDSSAALEVTAHSDAIRHTIIMLFSRQPTEKIKTSGGRDDILDQALRELQDLMLKETGRTLIDRVLFTAFVLQT
jgi:flagellar FliL protein